MLGNGQPRLSLNLDLFNKVGYCANSLAHITNKTSKIREIRWFSWWNSDRFCTQIPRFIPYLNLTFWRHLIRKTCCQDVDSFISFAGHVSVRALSVDRTHLRSAVPLLPVAEARSRRVRRPRISPAHRSVQLDLHWKTNEKIPGTYVTVTWHQYLIYNILLYLNAKWATAFGILKILNEERHFDKIYSKVQSRKYKVTSVKKNKRLCASNDLMYPYLLDNANEIQRLKNKADEPDFSRNQGKSTTLNKLLKLIWAKKLRWWLISGIRRWTSMQCII